MLKQLTHRSKFASTLISRPEMAIRPLIFLGVVAFSIGFALISYKLKTSYLLVFAGLLPAIGAVLFILRYPPIGILFTIIGGIFIPFSGPGGINVTILGVLFMVVVWIFKMVSIDRRIVFIRSRVMVPIFIFLLSAFISFIFGQLPWYEFASQAPIDAQVGGFLIFLMAGGALLSTSHLIQDIRWLKILTWVFLGIGGLYMVGRMAGIDLFDRVYQIGFISNSMFWTWLVALAFGQLLINSRLKWVWRGALVLLLGITMFVAYFINGDWKSGYVPALVAIAVIIAIRYPKLILVFSPVAVLGFFIVATQAISSDEYSWGTRLDAWLVILAIAKVSPILGMGFGNYSYYTPLFQIRGFYNIRFNSHSQYVDLIAQTGVVGLSIFVWILAEMSLLAYKLRNKIEDPFAKAYIYGVLGGIGGTIVAGFLVDWVLPYVYNIGLNGFRASVLPWIFFGGLVSLEQMINQKKVI